MRASASLALIVLWMGSFAPAADLGEQMDRLAQGYVDSGTVLGMSIGIVRGDEMVTRGYGQLSADDASRPDEQTLYEVGSITKVFTGLLLADAMVNGRVSLVTPVEDLLPEGQRSADGFARNSLRSADGFARNSLRGPNGQPIRLWHLSTHTSGLPRMPTNFQPADPNNPFADYNQERLLEFLKEHQLEKNPAESYAYSNLAVGLLGSVLAADRETDYATLLQDRVTKPLGLKHTRLVLDAEQQKKLAPPHGDGCIPNHTWDFDALAGAGAIRSNVHDLLKFSRAWLDPPSGKLGAAMEIAWQVHQKPIGPSDFAVGLGWHVARDGSTRFHNGQTGGYHSSLFVSRKFDTAVVVLTNVATRETDQLAEQLVRMAVGIEEKPREFPKQIEVSADILNRYVGKYHLADGVDFTVSVLGDKLLVGLTGQPTFRVYPTSETEWFYTVVDAKLKFHVDESGNCHALELFQNGVQQTAKRIESAD